MSAERGQDGLPMDAGTFFDRSGELGRCELVAGEVLPVTPAGFRHGRLEVRLAHLLHQYVEELGRGVVVCGEVGYELSDDTVRAPDVAVHLVTPQEAGGWVTEMPDVAVEILSPSDRWGQVEEKVAQYLEARVREVWIVDPGQETVTVRAMAPSLCVFRAADTLRSEVLEGFELQLESLFA